MAKIFYGLAGEGRGHATRAATLVEYLRHEHEVVVFAPGHAYRMLAPRYEGTDVRIEEIPGPCFHYDRRKRVSKLLTMLGFIGYLRRVQPVLRELAARIRRDKPALCITDFDPALPRAAERCGVPYASVDHQHFLVVSDLSGLPRRLRMHASMMARVVRMYYRRQVRSVVSSFYFPPLRRGFENVVQTGVLLRPALLDVQPERGEHLCVYLRRFAPDNVLEALRATGRECRIYGPDGTDSGNLRFRPIDEQRFVEDLATSAALITTAGNQLVGEAMWFGKPVLALPEQGNEEQEINACFLERSGGGAALGLEALQGSDLLAFLERLDGFRPTVERSRLNGNDVTLRTIHELLEQPLAS